jgi:predicted regulator of Ras-like GTPase activity (Roadblock/LC7/MglB family)
MDSVEEILSSMLEVPGVLMATLLGLDGMGVQTALSEDWQGVDTEALDIELATLANSVQRAAGGLGAEVSSEFIFGTVQVSFVGIMLNHPYFLVVGVEPWADLDLAREALSRAGEALVQSEVL